MDEITQALEHEMYNPITAAYLLFAEKNERAKCGRVSTRVTPRSTHISPIASQPASPRYDRELVKRDYVYSFS